MREGAQAVRPLERSAALVVGLALCGLLSACEFGDGTGELDRCQGFKCGVARRSVILEPGLGAGNYEINLGFSGPSTIAEQCHLTVGTPIPATETQSAATPLETDCVEYSFNLWDEGLVSQIVIASGVENANDPFDRASLTLWEDEVLRFGEVRDFEPIEILHDDSMPECGGCDRYRATFQVD